MKKLILHIGTNKTGTTSIQLFLKKNYRHLKDEGIFFPDIGATILGAHHYFAASMCNERNSIYLQDRTYKDLSDQIFNESKGLSTTVISSELLLSKNVFDVDKLKYFSDRYDETKIIIYFRRQDEYVNSFYNSRVKTGRYSGDINEFASKFFRDYNIVLEKLADIFGEKNIIPRIYDIDQFYNNNLLYDFLDLIGIRDFNKFDFNIPQSNSSATSDAIYVLRSLNKLDKRHSQKFRNKVVKYFASNGKVPKMNYETATNLLHRHEECNQALGRWFGTPNHNPFSNSEVQYEKSTFPPPSIDEVVYILSKVYNM